MSYGIFGAEKRPVITIVMDGIGICAREEGNAIKAADTPTLDMLAENIPASASRLTAPQ